MKTIEAALADLEAKFRSLIEAQRAVVLTEQGKLRELEQQNFEAVGRVQNYFSALEARARADVLVANPPDEVKENGDGSKK